LGFPQRPFARNRYGADYDELARKEAHGFLPAHLAALCAHATLAALREARSSHIPTSLVMWPHKVFSSTWYVCVCLRCHVHEIGGDNQQRQGSEDEGVVVAPHHFREVLPVVRPQAARLTSGVTSVGKFCHFLFIIIIYLLLSSSRQL
jgi:hypothetical protein